MMKTIYFLSLHADALLCYVCHIKLFQNTQMLSGCNITQIFSRDLNTFAIKYKLDRFDSMCPCSFHNIDLRISHYLFTCCIAHYQSHQYDWTGGHGSKIEVRHGVEVEEATVFRKNKSNNKRAKAFYIFSS